MWVDLVAPLYWLRGKPRHCGHFCESKLAHLEVARAHMHLLLLRPELTRLHCSKLARREQSLQLLPKGFGARLGIALAAGLGAGDCCLLVAVSIALVPYSYRLRWRRLQSFTSSSASIP